VATLFLVRHAHAAASYGDSADPGLDDVGRAQAEAAGRELAARLSVLPVYSSPMQRCRETAAPLAATWGAPATILAAVGEIPAPPISLSERQAWLRKATAGTWAEMKRDAPPGSPDFDAWRAALLGALRGMTADAVIFSHYIAINAVVGAAQGDDRVICFRPDYVSVTAIEVSSGMISVRELGRQAGEGGTTILPGR